MLQHDRLILVEVNAILCVALQKFGILSLVERKTEAGAQPPGLTMGRKKLVSFGGPIYNLNNTAARIKLLNKRHTNRQETHLEIVPVSMTWL